MNSESKTINVQHQTLLDLSSRARGGIIIYCVVWFITAFWAQIPANNFFAFALVSAFIAGVSILRAIHYLLLPRYLFTHTKLMYDSLVWLILIIGLIWGFLSSWVLFFSGYEQLRLPYMVTLAAVGIGGTSVLSISRRIAFCYPFFIFLPSIGVGMAIGNSEDMFMSLLGFLSMIYVVDASKAIRKDYQTAIANRVIAEERLDQLKKANVTDSLTGLKNRKYFTEQISIEWARCSRSESPLSILMYDLDYFKKINDQYGHIAGDMCLQNVAKMMTEEVTRATDIVARYGGEEFIIILPNTSLEHAALLADKLISATQNINFKVEEQPVSITSSIGVACTIPDFRVKPEKLIALADKALYEAKSSGRNCFRVHANNEN
jgi:diguanylate cyclase (GGDEF)-like protein